MKAAEEERAKAQAEGDTLSERTIVVADNKSSKASSSSAEKRNTKKRASTKAKTSQPKASAPSNSGAEKSVRRRKK